MAAKKWEGPPCLAFKVPNTDVEIITFVAGTTLRGMVCNPKKLLSPTPWSGTCPHCRQKGQDKKWGRAAMKAVQIMCSTRLIPPNVYKWNLSPRYKARGTIYPDEWAIIVERPEKDLLLNVIRHNKQAPIVIAGVSREFRSEHVKLGIKLILSGHVPTKNEVKACLRGLREAESPAVKTPCWELAEAH